MQWMIGISVYEYVSTERSCDKSPDKSRDVAGGEGQRPDTPCAPL
jgi:hypothetical protein